MSAAPFHVHLDAVGGIAGDMFAGAMLEALPHLAPQVLADCRAVLPGGAAPALTKGQNSAIAGARLTLASAIRPDDTRYKALAQRIDEAALPPATAAKSHAILAALAGAEAAIHGVALDEVHFHELADWDSLMDVVAAGSILAACEGASFSHSPLPLGSGTVKTQHGVLPVPAPATARLLQGLAVFDDGVPGERITPTGAAILSVLPLGPRPAGTIAAQGFGIGTKRLPGVANVLRALVINVAAPAAWSDETIAEIAFEVDDMTGEEIGEAAERLRAVPGVLDLTTGARSGKKARPMTDFRLLTTPDARDSAISAVFDQTATIGVRVAQTGRCILRRETHTISLADTALAIKAVHRPGGTTRKVEARSVAGATLADRRRVRRSAEDDPC